MNLISLISSPPQLPLPEIFVLLRIWSRITEYIVRARDCPSESFRDAKASVFRQLRGVRREKTSVVLVLEEPLQSLGVGGTCGINQ